MNNINISSIRRKALGSKKLEKNADLIIKKKLDTAQKEFLNDFDQHPITQELSSKESASNISNTLNGKGNLFTFIGFEKSSNPVEDLRNLIINQFNFRRIRNSKNIKYSISFPSLDKLRRGTPMPWEGGRSWVEAIEKGISGLSYYLFKKSNASRSGGGLQSNNKVSAASYKPRSYLSEITEKFKRNIRK